jgi:hypothetical protein
VKRLKGIVLVAFSLLMVAVPLFAHHGTAAYDTKTIVLNASVTDWVWANPHCILKFDAKDDSGNVLHWSAETSNPADMVKRGWDRHLFKAGSAVTVSLQQVKNGSPVGRILEVMLPDGRVLLAMGPQSPVDPKP